MLGINQHLDMIIGQNIHSGTVSVRDKSIFRYYNYWSKDQVLSGVETSARLGFCTGHLQRK